MNTGRFHRINSSDSSYSPQKAFSRQGRLLHIKGCLEWPLSQNAYFREAFWIRGVYWEWESKNHFRYIEKIMKHLRLSTAISVRSILLLKPRSLVCEGPYVYMSNDKTAITPIINRYVIPKVANPNWINLLRARLKKMNFTGTNELR